MNPNKKRRRRIHIPTATLRNWGGAVAVSLPKKVLAALGQLEKEQRALERGAGSPVRRRGLDRFAIPGPGTALTEQRGRRHVFVVSLAEHNGRGLVIALSKPRRVSSSTTSSAGWRRW